MVDEKKPEIATGSPVLAGLDSDRCVQATTKLAASSAAARPTDVASLTNSYLHRPDYSLNNPDTLTKYKTAGQIAEKVLARLAASCVPGAKVVDLCEQGDKLIEEEIEKVYRGKKVIKGSAHPATVSGSSFVTPYTPLKGDEAEAAAELKADEPVKIQLGAQIDLFGAIVCDTVYPKAEDTEDGPVTGRQADLALATYFANELLLRLMIPPGLLAQGSDEEKAKAASVKAPTASKITSLLEKVAQAYECNLVENTTSWLFERDNIESSKRLVIASTEGSKSEGVPAVGEVWGVEMGVSLGSGKVKPLEQRSTLHRRTTHTYQLTRPTSRKILTEVNKRFHHFPFSLRQLENERDAKSGVVECVRSNVFRQYEVIGDKDAAPVARLLTTIAITKNGITRLSAPPPLDLSKYQSDKKIEDEQILTLLAQPLSRNTGNKKSKGKKKKPAKKEGEAGAEAEETEEAEEAD